MNARPRPRRRLAVLAVLAAVGVAITAVIATTAWAATTGTCTSAVNVRKEPSISSPIVGVCERGHSTQVGEKRNGFVRLNEFGGWASAQFVSTGSEGSQGSSAPNRARDDESSSSPSTSNPLTNPRSSTPRSSSPQSSTPRSNTPGISINSDRSSDDSSHGGSGLPGVLAGGN